MHKDNLDDSFTESSSVSSTTRELVDDMYKPEGGRRERGGNMDYRAFK
jgi:hypothetical protein